MAREVTDPAERAFFFEMKEKADAKREAERAKATKVGTSDFMQGAERAQRDLKGGFYAPQLHRDAMRRQLYWQGYAVECAKAMAEDEDGA